MLNLVKTTPPAFSEVGEQLRGGGVPPAPCRRGKAEEKYPIAAPQAPQGGKWGKYEKTCGAAGAAPEEKKGSTKSPALCTFDSVNNWFCRAQFDLALFGLVVRRAAAAAAAVAAAAASGGGQRRQQQATAGSGGGGWWRAAAAGGGERRRAEAVVVSGGGQRQRRRAAAQQRPYLTVQHSTSLTPTLLNFANNATLSNESYNRTTNMLHLGTQCRLETTEIWRRRRPRKK
eukprot:gene24482-biopygen10437